MRPCHRRPARPTVVVALCRRGQAADRGPRCWPSRHHRRSSRGAVHRRSLYRHRRRGRHRRRRLRWAARQLGYPGCWHRHRRRHRINGEKRRPQRRVGEFHCSSPQIIFIYTYIYAPTNSDTRTLPYPITSSMWTLLFFVFIHSIIVW